MEINILELAKRYEKNEKVLNEIEIESYIPFVTKRAVIDTIIETIIEYDNSLIKYEPMDKHFNFVLSFITLYTNLVFGSEEGFEAYDILMSTDILDYIIQAVGADYAEFVALFEETLQSRINFNNSIQNQIGMFLGSLDKVIENLPELLEKLPGDLYENRKDKTKD